MHYEDLGQGRPVVMLHGFSLDHRVMTGCMEPVFKNREGWRRIYPDLPGMGRTRAPEWITSSDHMLDVVMEFIDSVIPGEDFVLAGESYGGYLALGALHRRPDSVGGLLLICPVMVAQHSRRNVPAHVILVEDGELHLGSSTADEMFRSMAVVQDVRHWERFQEDILPGTGMADGGFLEILQGSGYPLSFDVADTPFEKPALILLGRQDSVVGYRDSLSLVDNLARGTLAVLDRSGHDLQIEQEHLFYSLVGEWLDRIDESEKP